MCFFTVSSGACAAAVPKAIHGHVLTFLRSRNGAFYVSHDANIVTAQHAEAHFALGDAGRRRQGIRPSTATSTRASKAG
jgi:hypothetical protein